MRPRARRQQALLTTQTHGAAKLRVLVAPLARTLFVLPFGNQGNHRVARIGVEFGTVRLAEAGDTARVFDHRHLHAQTDAEKRDVVLARQTHGLDLALDAAQPETAWHQDGVHVRQARNAVRTEFLGIEIFYLDLSARMDARVPQRLVQ